MTTFDGVADFESSVRQRAAVIEDAIALLGGGDLAAFVEVLDGEIELPEFEAAFDLAASRLPHLALAARREACRLGSLVGESLPGGIQALTNVFAVPVTYLDVADAVGAVPHIEATLRSTLEPSLGGSLHLVPYVAAPSCGGRISPPTLRDLSRFYRARSGLPDVDAVAIAQADIEDALFIADRNDDMLRGFADTGLVFGFYTRTYDMRRAVLADPFTLSLCSGSMDGLLGATEHVDSVSGVVFGNAHWPRKACSAALAQHVRHNLAHEVMAYGGAVGPIESISLSETPSGYLALASAGGAVLGPVEAVMDRACVESVAVSRALSKSAGSRIGDGTDTPTLPSLN